MNNMTLNNRWSIGVYMIEDSYTKRTYVGQTSSSFKVRWKQHITSLEKHSHSNHSLQKAFNNPKSVLNFKILEIVESEILSSGFDFTDETKKLCYKRERFHMLLSQNVSYSMNTIADLFSATSFCLNHHMIPEDDLFILKQEIYEKRSALGRYIQRKENDKNSRKR